VCLRPRAISYCSQMTSNSLLRPRTDSRKSLHRYELPTRDFRKGRGSENLHLLGIAAGEPGGCGSATSRLPTSVGRDGIHGEPLGYKCGVVDEDQRVGVEVEPLTHRGKLTTEAREAP
jgi:hypothetical protein